MLNNARNAMSQLPIEFKVIGQFRAINRAFGYGANGSHSFKATILFMLMICCVINILAGLKHNWDDLESRVLRLRDVQFFFILILFHFISLRFEEMCDLMEAHFSRHHEIDELAEINRRFRIEHGMDLEKYCRYATFIMAFRNSATSFVPMAYSVFLVIRAAITGQWDTLNPNLPIITYFHYPKNYSTWQVKLFLNAVATYFYYANTLLGVIIVMINYFLGHISWYQFGLLNRYLMELDKLESWEEVRLKQLMFDIIKYHQHISIHHMRFKKCSHISNMTYNFGVTFQLCTYIYSVIEMRKARFLVQMLFALVLLYAFSSYGQKIVDEGDRVRESLYNCEWSGRPLWFQKNLLIIMIRADVSTEINFHGMMSLNRNRFSKTLQAAYTYFNFLKGTIDSNQI